MASNYTVADVLSRLPKGAGVPLEAPPYTGTDGPCVGLTTDANRCHMSDEAHQLFQGLALAGYTLCGHGITTRVTSMYERRDFLDVPTILEDVRPSVVALQDPREWMGLTADRSRDPAMRFRNLDALRERPDVFRVGVLKDAHGDADLHRATAAEAGLHAWVCYYDPRIVSHLAGYVRSAHLLRTYHTVDAAAVPAYTPEGRGGCLLSGALSAAYPLRQRLVREVGHLPETVWLPFPGYHRRGCETPKFLQTLSHFKASLCTASRYGFALRKIVESTAAGCVVITDLPTDEVMPGGIDGNLARVHPDWPTRRIANIVREVIAGYDPGRQEYYAELACRWYDYRAEGARLAAGIEAMRRGYNAPTG